MHTQKLIRRLDNISRQNPVWVAWILAAGAFADASVWPFPIATLFTMTLIIYPEKAGRLVFTCTAGTVMGAIAGYLAGRYLWTLPGGEYTKLALFAFRHISGFTESTFLNAATTYSKWNIWLLTFGAFTPVPYGLFSLASGIFNMGFLLFFPAVVVSHLIKYLFLSFIAVRYGHLVLRILRIRGGIGLIIILAITLVAVVTALLL